MEIVPPARRAAAVCLLWLVPAAVAAATSGCKKDEQPQQAGGANTVNIGVNPGAGAPVQTRVESGITRYSDEGPESGTLLTKGVTIVRKSADPGGEILTRLGPGTGVNRKARHGPYYLIDFPGGNPGEMKPGWALQSDLGSAALPQPTPTPTATVAPTATVTTAPGGRPPPVKINR